ncbi:MAG: SDR family oxidoreductase [Ilumatobacteraceae bacterium]|nr:SDR family oxidoreductase [Ilumatobacteraceae bacterium]
MDLGITGRTAAVAAASAGLGLASARALVEAGVTVAICGRDEDRITAAARLLGERAIALVCDVDTQSGGRVFVEQAIDRLGHVDILVTNGGGPPAGTFASTPSVEYAKALEKNLLSVVGMCGAALPGMQERGWGRVIAITSSAVRQPIPNLILSNTARAGITGFLKTVAREVAHRGVTVNTVQPGIHATDRILQLYGANADPSTLGIPTGTLGDPADFGHVVAFLCGEQAKFVTGANLQVDGGAYAGLI